MLLDATLVLDHQSIPLSVLVESGTNENFLDVKFSLARIGVELLESRQVKTDPDKIHAAAEWPKLSSLKQLQCFLGFANFYWQFIIMSQAHSPNSPQPL